MATINWVAPDNDGAIANLVAATSGGDVLATGHAHVVFRVKNGSGSAVTVTLAGAVECSQGGLHNQVVVCGAGNETDIEVSGHVVDQDGHVAVTYSAVTTVTVALLKV